MADPPAQRRLRVTILPSESGEDLETVNESTRAAISDLGASFGAISEAVRHIFAEPEITSETLESMIRYGPWGARDWLPPLSGEMEPAASHVVAPDPKLERDQALFENVIHVICDMELELLGEKDGPWDYDDKTRPKEPGTRDVASRLFWGRSKLTGLLARRSLRPGGPSIKWHEVHKVAHEFSRTKKLPRIF